MKKTSKQIFKKIKNLSFRLLKPRGVEWIMVFAIAVLGFLVLQKMGVFGSVSEVFAQQNSSTGVKTSSTVSGDVVGALGRGFGGAVSALATLFFKLISGILFFVLKWMGPLMDNTFILEGEIGVKIRTVWVIVRNFVNIFFALALVVVAFMSVIGYGDESGNYAMKKFIPKMALALIAVNFTFLGAKIILDINNVLTTAIFSIPRSVTTVGDIGPTGLSGQLIFKKMDCFNSSANLQKEIKRTSKLQKKFKGTIASIAGVCFAEKPKEGETFQVLRDRGKASGKNQSTEDKKKQAIISMDKSLFTKHDFVWVMATQFQGIHDLNKISALLDPTFSGLTVNALFSAVFAVIYATAYISMFIILIARMAVLWVTIMLSPLIAITIVFPELKIQEFDIQEQFLKHAFVPAKMAVPLSLGFIMLSQMTLSVHTGDAIFKNEIIDLTGGEFARGVSFTTLIYGAASVAVLWMGVFAATKGVVGEGIVTGFSDQIKGIGKSVAKWPAYIPVIPVSGGLSLSNMKYAIGSLKDRIEQSRLESNRETADKLWGQYFPSSEIKEAIEKVEHSVKQGRLDTTSFNKIISQGSKAQVASALVKILDKENDINTEEKQRIAEMAGVEYRGGGGWEKLLKHAEKNKNMKDVQTQLKKNLPSGGGLDSKTGESVNYDDYQSKFTGDNGKLKIDADSLSDSEKIELGLKKSDSGDKDIIIQNIGLTSFIKSFIKLQPGDRRALINSEKNEKFFETLKTGKGLDVFREKLNDNPDFKKSLKTALSLEDSDKDLNKKILEIYKKIVPGEVKTIQKEWENAGYKFK